MNASQPDEERVLAGYKTFLKKALQDKETGFRKSELVGYFSEQPHFGMLPEFWIPSVFLCLLFGFFFTLLPGFGVKTNEVAKDAAESLVLLSNEESSSAPQTVNVKKLTSREGTTLVYQIPEGKMPMTVIWIFPQ